MMNTARTAFSQDGRYFAHCESDGKLKIFKTATSRLKQDNSSNLHLNSPCSVLCWISINTQATHTSPFLRSKRRKKIIAEEKEEKKIIAMGSVNGIITLYDVAAATVFGQLENGHSSCVTAITWSTNTGLFTAADDGCIIQWNIQENGMKSKWKSGKTKVVALAVMEDGKTVISADKIIKWWDLSTKTVIKTFIGHGEQVTSLNAITVEKDVSYLISGANDDKYLSVWSLNEAKNNKCSVATLAMQDEASSVSVHLNEESQLMVLANTRSGQVHVFKYQPNGISKPLKPILTIAVTTSDENKKETVQQIPIVKAKLIKNEKLLIAYGAYTNLTFEKITPIYTDKIQVLIRSEVKIEKKEESVTEVKAAITENNVEYFSPGTGKMTTKRHRTSSASSQLILANILENLSLNVDNNITSRVTSKGTNIMQLLMQGLDSKCKNIRDITLFTQNEGTIRSTIAKLPVQAITPLIKELCTMLQGKMYSSIIAAKCLEILITTHATHIFSHPDIGEALNTILSLIDSKLTIFTEISKLRGRISLLKGQISRTDEEQDAMENSLLVYQDTDSSDEGPAMEDAVESESDEFWEEMSEQEDQEGQNENNDSNSVEFKVEDNMSN